MVIRKLMFVVNGQETVVLIAENATLKKAAETALMQTENTGRPANDFQIYLAYDTPDNGDKPVSAYSKLQMMQPIFLSLKAGIGA